MMKKINVGYKTYTIKIVDDLHSQRGLKADGAHSYYGETIEIDSKIPKAREVDCIIHETLHALVAHFDLHDDLDSKLEEKVVTALSTGLCMVFKSNPGLLKYIAKNLK